MNQFDGAFSGLPLLSVLMIMQTKSNFYMENTPVSHNADTIIISSTFGNPVKATSTRKLRPTSLVGPELQYLAVWYTGY